MCVVGGIGGKVYGIFVTRESALSLTCFLVPKHIESLLLFFNIDELSFAIK